VELFLVITVVVVALSFDYTNGFHDAANAIATSVSTRALTPRAALGLAAVMNFAGAFLGQEVASTVSEVITPPTGEEGLVVIIAALLGAIGWNLTTWYFGMPSSSSHALIGGLVGAAIAAGTTIHWSAIKEKVLIPMVLSPIVGFIVAFLVMLAILWIFRRRTALIEQVLAAPATTDPVISAAHYQQILGARAFILQLLNIAEQTKAVPQPLPTNLDHGVK
jgi:PiT family inorganic phosphate transporter